MTDMMIAARDATCTVCGEQLALPVLGESASHEEISRALERMVNDHALVCAGPASPPEREADG